MASGIQRTMDKQSEMFPNDYCKRTQREIGGTGNCNVIRRAVS